MEINGPYGCMQLSSELCDLCKTLTKDILSGEFSNIWGAARGECHAKFELFEYLHHTKEYFQTLKQPCCCLCEVMAHSMWRNNSDCALQWHEDWQLRVYLDRSEARLDFMDIVCSPGEVTTWTGTLGLNALVKTFMLGFFHSTKSEVGPGDSPILPDLPDGLPVREIRGWVDACMGCSDGHENCQRPVCPLPTRLLDLSSNPIKVVEFHDIQEPYVALSHCWGGPIKTRLLHENKKEFMDGGIPEAILPATFKDSIAITKRLGFRYLWIDALSIQQDDDEDWEREASLMCQVYEGAAFVLSAYSTPGSEAGLRFRRSAHVASDGDGKLYALRGGLRIFDTEEPLSSRGWTLQEHALCIAYLSIGRGFVKWTCQGGMYFEGEGGLISKTSNLNDKLNNILRSSARGDKFSIARAWRKIVEEYSSRHLSYSEDKMAAIAGIATKIEASFRESQDSGPGNVYVAGLWKETLLEDLIWSTEPNTKIIPRFERAPSWSWVGWDAPVHWRILQSIQDIDSRSGQIWNQFKQLCRIDEVELDNTSKAAKSVHGKLHLTGLMVFISAEPVQSVPLPRGRPVGGVRDPDFDPLDTKVLSVFAVPYTRKVTGNIDGKTSASCWALRLCSGYSTQTAFATVFMLLDQIQDSTSLKCAHVFRRAGLIVVTHDVTQILYDRRHKKDPPDPCPWPPVHEDPIGWTGEEQSVVVI